jgi:hypothetical protein
MNNKNTLYVLTLVLTMLSVFHCETVKVIIYIHIYNTFSTL